LTEKSGRHWEADAALLREFLAVIGIDQDRGDLRQRIREFDRAEGWRTHGYRSLSDLLRIRFRLGYQQVGKAVIRWDELCKGDDEHDSDGERTA
jgi:hypothetical protein